MAGKSNKTTWSNRLAGAKVMLLILQIPFSDTRKERPREENIILRVGILPEEIEKGLSIYLYSPFRHTCVDSLLVY